MPYALFGFCMAVNGQTVKDKQEVIRVTNEFSIDFLTEPDD